MGTSKEDIRGWLEHGLAEGATHVIIVCDTFDHEDYPVFVMPGEDAHEKAQGFSPGYNMQRVMEVYSLSLPIEDQLNERRAFHF